MVRRTQNGSYLHYKITMYVQTDQLLSFFLNLSPMNMPLFLFSSFPLNDDLHSEVEISGIDNNTIAYVLHIQDFSFLMSQTMQQSCRSTNLVLSHSALVSSAPWITGASFATSAQKAPADQYPISHCIASSYYDPEQPDVPASNHSFSHKLGSELGSSANK